MGRHNAAGAGPGAVALAGAPASEGGPAAAGKPQLDKHQQERQERRLLERKAVESTRKRLAAIERYIDLIPARLYLAGDCQQVMDARGSAGLDPTQLKRTSQIVSESAAAQRAEGEGGAGGRGSKAGKSPKEKKKAAREQGDAASPEAVGGKRKTARTQQDLHDKLSARIAELKEERRQKQSEKDKATAAAVREKRDAEGTVRPDRKPRGAKPAPGSEATKEVKASKPAAEAKANKPAAEASKPSPEVVKVAKASAPEVEVEVGNVTFGGGEKSLPFEATAGRKGDKMRRLRNELRTVEQEGDRVRRAEAKGRGDDVRQEVALSKALKRARGEKVHDDSTKLRKAQKNIETKKKRGKDRWEASKEESKAGEKQQRTKKMENLQNRAAKSQKGKKNRGGFEGERGDKAIN